MPRRVKNKKTYKKRSWIILRVILGTMLSVAILGLLLFVYYIKDLPRPERFSEGSIAQSTKIYANDGKTLLYEIYDEERRTLVSLDEMPEYLKEAVISIEDRDFFKHEGVDIGGLIRAVIYDLRIGKPVQGGSTITQQLIRTYFLTLEKTIKRKTREIVLSLELERRYSKNQILEWYLNLVPFGPNVYGVEEASQYYFNKNVSNIDLPEAAVLASLIKAPSLLSPFGDNKDALLRRKNLVLDKMVEWGYLDKEKAEEAKNKEIVFEPQSNILKAPHFTLMVRDYLENKYGKEFLTRKGLKVYTTLDWDIQKEAEDILQKRVEELKAYNAYNGSLVAMNSDTGDIIAMIGSKNWYATSSEACNQETGKCKFDPKTNAATSLRPPGSALKPFAYAKLLLNGFIPSSKLWDVKTEFNPNCSPNVNQEYGEYNTKCYHPKNYDDRYLGPITLRSALAQSRNVPSVKVLYLAGLNSFLDFIKNFGIKTLTDKGRFGLSLVLGGGEVKLTEMVGAYSVFAENGTKVSPNFIMRIEDPNGEILEEREVFRNKIIPSYIAKEINDILSDNEARAPMFGYNSRLHIEGYDVAAKTGTTQDYRDAWTLGYTPRVVLGVWVGNNDNSPMLKRPAVSMAGVIWNDVMMKLLQKYPSESFKAPEKRTPESAALRGELGNHSILYYLDKNDPQYILWERAVENFLNSF